MSTSCKLLMYLTLAMLLGSCTSKKSQDQSLSIQVDPEQPCVAKLSLESEFDNCLLIDAKRGRCLNDPECVCISPGNRLSWRVGTGANFELEFERDTWFTDCRRKSTEGQLSCQVAENAEKGVYDYQVVLEGCDGYDPRIVIWY